MQQVDNLRIIASHDVDSPDCIRDEIKITEKSIATVAKTRTEIQNVLHGGDDRLVVIVGPCSIHDTEAAIDYANRLLEYQKTLADDLIIVMRVYFEKPRTTVGWKGLVNDPYLDDSFQINKGIRLARKLLLDINNMGLPASTEFLDLISPQYIAELVSWGAIGARTTESQSHRELASGISCPIGFKNGTSGNIQIAADAIAASSKGHHFLALTKEGKAAIFRTSGNEDCHLILRGGKKSPNYESESVNQAVNDLKANNSQPKVMIDFSHANSRKQYERQIEVAKSVCQQIAQGNDNIMGVMIESNIVAGAQKLTSDKEALVYGKSITDACLDFTRTVEILKNLSLAVQQRRKTK